MKVLVIGSGGREHALVWKIAQSPLAEKIYCAPGNPGTAQFAESVPLAAHDIAGLKKFALEKKIGLTVVGPEVPLVAGIADEFAAAGLKVFGPGRQGAQIEGSKVFSKNFMTKYDIPTAQSGTFRRLDEAVAYVKEMGAPIVVKADGLAAGKGVVVCRTEKEAIEALKLIMEKKEFGAAGDQVVVEEFLDGEEASILALTDGISILPLASAQDHKRVQDGDMGPNTGGMGAYSPAPIVTDHLMSEIDVTVLKPFIDGMRQEGISYKGVIYAGIMVTKKGPKVLEFNCRFGDPETQPIMMRMKSDLVPIMEAIIDEKLDGKMIEWHEQAAVCVVLAAGGYPGKYEKGIPITGLDRIDQLENVMVFHAGTKEESGKIVSAGGRVLGVTARGDSIKFAIKKAYQAVDLISFKGMHYRKDIGKKALKYER
ncbi:phosphoribosylamine--glycine ligase [candidate division WOR-1 bacterium RIFOXYA12_FULL_52_29]|uniref:Phosphoribosylamine--glycine ligase n=1 Tax=candidate division WOR-1 bacterium RIFOXYC12_FULL_54_18 TaxID=1802584 RepID=A0A1F4T3Q4_UNCSA|nr:MAG: phosphoribosylamine--glycine ligase [candidate division WOR-1 bacterium RIFOXYA2_FULL_51_19]OGC17014.1 MAG: phosphoribosylamine--glycine ligase [candidate division WOR-1 bacterium RIFOXYA12_FULL_52_29]OGC25875.1 MAG: phosphoribosylamine--glycine ligase [candidate division WOR-1 bacterium RIFOXYB2_FULL_45_9]OGC27431.1 MAG: phosphoribosylamine--glycine ligase [candidate division WOR-1 bacterium RIFOXYC12_FULL_54_18]OGC29356.1 MAG: phosphoribosylamine--glycine ligase [candidate division WO